jgi:hypothetical protein
LAIFCRNIWCHDWRSTIWVSRLHIKSSDTNGNNEKSMLREKISYNIYHLAYMVLMVCRIENVSNQQKLRKRERIREKCESCLKAVDVQKFFYYLPEEYCSASMFDRCLWKIVFESMSLSEYPSWEAFSCCSGRTIKKRRRIEKEQ